jgi:hypothetical protein
MKKLAAFTALVINLFSSVLFAQNSTTNLPALSPQEIENQIADGKTLVVLGTASICIGGLFIYFAADPNARGVDDEASTVIMTGTLSAVFIISGVIIDVMGIKKIKKAKAYKTSLIFENNTDHITGTHTLKAKICHQF